MMFGWQYLSEEDSERVLRGIESGRAFGGPWHLEIHPTNRCNLGCFFCSARPHREDEELPWNVLEKTLRHAKDVRSVRLTGGGESLIYPHITALLDLLGERGIRLNDLTTNGLALGSFAETVVCLGTDEIAISLNETDEDAYSESMRVKPRAFHQVLESIEAFNEARRTVAPEERPTLTLKFFVWKRNFRDVPRMLGLADRLGADRVLLNAIQFLPDSERIGTEDAETARHILRETLEAEAIRRPLRVGVDLAAEPAIGAFALRTFHEALPPGADPMPDAVTDAERCEYCYMGWYSATIAATGEVYPCCNFEGRNDKIVGNLHEESLDTIWHGAGFRRMRREFRNLALLGGELEHSCRLQRFTEPTCIARRKCPMGYYLCASDFYREAARRLAARRHLPRRLIAEATDGWIRMVHRLKG